MSDWRVAKSLLTLRGQINAIAPNRDDSGDGTIGDEAHASRSSDHNPWVKDGKTGVVTGMDITHDPAHGVNSQRFAEALLASRDSRLKYVISNRKIASGSDGPSPWTWRPYNGKNAHNHHFHISVKSDKAHYDSVAPWALDLDAHPEQTEKPATPVLPKKPVLKIGESGDAVGLLQTLLNKYGATLKADGKFGASTKAAVAKFQSKHGLVADGAVGVYTWEALEAKAT